MIWILAALVVLWQAPGSQAQEEESPRLKLPRSQLGNTLDEPIFLAFHGAWGGALDYEVGNLGFGASFVFRPDAAGRFLNFLYDTSTGMVLQADYMKVAADRRILSGDLILRHYLVGLPDGGDSVSPFAGAGIGGSEITLAPGEGGSTLMGFSWLIEIGFEWEFLDRFLGLAKVQMRNYSHDGFDYSHWSFMGGAGFPLPW